LESLGTQEPVSGARYRRTRPCEAQEARSSTIDNSAAQGGNHEDGRATFGHSLIISPWGDIIGELAHDNLGVLLADLDLERVTSARDKIPCLTHDRDYQSP
jgi:predicted amidohydrolase